MDCRSNSCVKLPSWLFGRVSDLFPSAKQWKQKAHPAEKTLKHHKVPGKINENHVGSLGPTGPILEYQTVRDAMIVSAAVSRGDTTESSCPCRASVNSSSGAGGTNNLRKIQWIGWLPETIVSAPWELLEFCFWLVDMAHGPYSC